MKWHYMQTCTVHELTYTAGIAAEVATSVKISQMLLVAMIGDFGQ